MRHRTLRGANLPLFAAALSLYVAGAACGAQGGAGQSEDETRSRDASSDARAPDAEAPDADAGELALELMVSVDWEGRELSEANLAAFEAFRARFPDVPLTQFLNAAYYTKPGADAADVTKRVERALRPGDEHGLHVHGWKRLVERAGVTFRDEPTFWGGGRGVGDCTFDCGHEVPMSAYTTAELRSLFKFSLDELERHGFTRPTSFRTGGWMARPNVREALVAEGIVRDGSAVQTALLREEIGTLPLYTWLTELWPDVGPASQPYVLDTPAGPLLEIPDNGGLADYTPEPDIVATYEACLAAKRAAPSEPVAINVGFHQETAARFLPRLAAGLDLVRERAKADGVRLEAVTFDHRAAPRR